MKKIDVNVSRTLTINTGNYGSIKPSVNLSVKEVDSDQVEDVYGCLQTILDILMKFEVVQSMSLEKEVNALGVDSFCRDTLEKADELGEEINQALSVLSSIK